MIYKYEFFNGRKAKYCDSSGTYTGISGVQYMYDGNPALGENGPAICVDLNGAAGPNVMGIDYFIFVPTLDGNIIPMGEEHPNNTAYKSGSGANNFYDKTLCKKTNGYACAYWALKNISPLDSTKTYWNDFIAKKQYK